MSLFPDTHFERWTRQDVASFTKRYFQPLWRCAQLDFGGLDRGAAQDLAQAFLLRELQRTPVFERYETGRGHDAKFRTYLRTCFFRFARDELAKERRRRALSLDALPVEPPDRTEGELDRLVLRDLLATLREAVTEGEALSAEGQRYFDLKWPADPERGSASDAEIGAALGLPRGQLRTVKKQVVGRIVVALRQLLHRDGLRGRAADSALEEYVALLRRHDPEPA